ncbi:collagen alpha-1(I) chain-like [Schistocerca americana]|uniref:collagen alpha-1(I) chain-like n=1 Tax=Schistocerca americana TaxID=7009 RepID=UPI001F4FA562|nr:collagen alpha-1(I) chain-like [Schistocerca americana]
MSQCLLGSLQQCARDASVGHVSAGSAVAAAAAGPTWPLAGWMGSRQRRPAEAGPQPAASSQQPAPHPDSHGLHSSAGAAAGGARRRAAGSAVAAAAAGPTWPLAGWMGSRQRRPAEAGPQPAASSQQPAPHPDSHGLHSSAGAAAGGARRRAAGSAVAAAAAGPTWPLAGWMGSCQRRPAEAGPQPAASSQQPAPHPDSHGLHSSAGAAAGGARRRAAGSAVAAAAAGPTWPLAGWMGSRQRRPAEAGPQPAASSQQPAASSPPSQPRPPQQCWRRSWWCTQEGGRQCCGSCRRGPHVATGWLDGEPPEETCRGGAAASSQQPAASSPPRQPRPPQQCWRRSWWCTQEGGRQCCGSCRRGPHVATGWLDGEPPEETCRGGAAASSQQPAASSPPRQPRPPQQCWRRSWWCTQEGGRQCCGSCRRGPHVATGWLDGEPPEETCRGGAAASSQQPAASSQLPTQPATASTAVLAPQLVVHAGGRQAVLWQLPPRAPRGHWLAGWGAARGDLQRRGRSQQPAASSQLPTQTATASTAVLAPQLVVHAGGRPAVLWQLPPRAPRGHWLAGWGAARGDLQRRGRSQQPAASSQLPTQTATASTAVLAPQLVVHAGGRPAVLWQLPPRAPRGHWLAGWGAARGDLQRRGRSQQPAASSQQPAPHPASHGLHSSAGAAAGGARRRAAGSAVAAAAAGPTWPLAGWMGSRQRRPAEAGPQPAASSQQPAPHPDSHGLHSSAGAAAGGARRRAAGSAVAAAAAGPTWPLAGWMGSRQRRPAEAGPQPAASSQQPAPHPDSHGLHSSAGAAAGGARRRAAGSAVAAAAAGPTWPLAGWMGSCQRRPAEAGPQPAASSQQPAPHPDSHGLHSSAGAAAGGARRRAAGSAVAAAAAGPTWPLAGWMGSRQRRPAEAGPQPAASSQQPAASSPPSQPRPPQQCWRRSWWCTQEGGRQCCGSCRRGPHVATGWLDGEPPEETCRGGAAASSQQPAASSPPRQPRPPQQCWRRSWWCTQEGGRQCCGSCRRGPHVATGWLDGEPPEETCRGGAAASSQQPAASSPPRQPRPPQQCWRRSWWCTQEGGRQCCGSCRRGPHVATGWLDGELPEETCRGGAAASSQQPAASSPPRQPRPPQQCWRRSWWCTQEGGRQCCGSCRRGPHVATGWLDGEPPEETCRGGAAASSQQPAASSQLPTQTATASTAVLAPQLVVHAGGRPAVLWQLPPRAPCGHWLAGWGAARGDLQRRGRSQQPAASSQLPTQTATASTAVLAPQLVVHAGGRPAVLWQLPPRAPRGHWLAGWGAARGDLQRRGRSQQPAASSQQPAPHPASHGLHSSAGAAAGGARRRAAGSAVAAAAAGPTWPLAGWMGSCQRRPAEAGPQPAASSQQPAASSQLPTQPATASTAVLAPQLVVHAGGRPAVLWQLPPRAPRGHWLAGWGAARGDLQRRGRSQQPAASSQQPAASSPPSQLRPPQQCWRRSWWCTQEGGRQCCGSCRRGPHVATGWLDGELPEETCRGGAAASSQQPAASSQQPAPHPASYGLHSSAGAAAGGARRRAAGSAVAAAAAGPTWPLAGWMGSCQRRPAEGRETVVSRLAVSAVQHKRCRIQDRGELGTSTPHTAPPEVSLLVAVYCSADSCSTGGIDGAKKDFEIADVCPSIFQKHTGVGQSLGFLVLQ